MSKVKRYIYSPNTIVLDMKKQPDAEEMVRIARSIKGTRVEVIKGGQIVAIHYPETKAHLNIHSKTKIARVNLEKLETGFTRLSFNKKESRKTKEDKSIDARLYHALILK